MNKMDPAIGLLICRWLSLIGAIGGAILVALGTYGTAHFNSTIDKRKESKIEDLFVGNTALMRQNQELISKVDKYQTDLEAKENQVKQLENEQEKLKEELREVDKKAEPNKISFLKKQVDKTDIGYKATICFKPVKNEPLGLLVFLARLKKGTTSKIVNIWPSIQGGAFSTGDGSKEIESNAQAAKLVYSIIGFGIPTIELTVTEPTFVLIEGNALLNPVEIEIK